MPESGTALRKSVGLLPLIALGTAGIVGTSWIYTNGVFFAKYGAGGEIFGLMLGALLAAFVALAYAELAAAFPRAGGEIVYTYLGFNRTTGFAAGWLLTGAYVSSLAFYVTALGTLLSDVVPQLATVPLYSIAGTTVHLPVLAVGVVLAVVVCAVNAYGMRAGAGTQLVLFVGMVLIGVALAVVGFTSGSAANFWPPYAPDDDPVTSTLRFVLPAMTFLTGFGLIAVLAEDANIHPRRIGRAVVAAVVAAGGFYCLVLLASAMVIPWTVTATFENGTIDAYRHAGFPLLSWGAYAISVIGLLTSFLALFIATSRILLAMGRAGLLPRVFAAVHPRRGTPVNALLLTLALTLGLGWLGAGAITWFLDTGGVFVGLAWVLGVASMYALRRRFPDLQRPYRVRAAWLPALGAVAALAIIVMSLVPGTGMSLVWPYEYVILAAWLLLGVLLYAFTRNRLGQQEALETLLGEHHFAALEPEAAAARRSPEPVADD